MEYNTEIQELLRKLEKNSRRQVGLAWVQCGFSLVSLVCCVVLLAAVLSFLPRLDSLTTQAETALANLNEASQALEALDMTGLTTELSGLITGVNALIQNADSMITTTQRSLEEALGKINAIDFEGLNKAIGDLAAVVKPLADFFNKF